MSQTYGGLWYLDPTLAADANLHQQLLLHLQNEFAKSSEIFAKDYRRKHPNRLTSNQRGYQSDEDPDAWIILEVATFGELSKIYKNISHQLPAKSAIAIYIDIVIYPYTVSVFCRTGKSILFGTSQYLSCFSNDIK